MSGKYVQCVVEETDGGTVVHQMLRSVCATQPKAECPSCPNRTYQLRFQLRVADQLVACPRWETTEDRVNRREPVNYEPMNRHNCLNVKPFPFCTSCPNGRASEVPRTMPKWFELEERKRRIELELDEEDRE